MSLLAFDRAAGARVCSAAVISASILVAFTRTTSADTAAGGERDPTVVVVRAEGDVRARAPKDKVYAPVASGASLASGSRLRVGEGAGAQVRFADGTSTTIFGGSEILLHATRESEKRPNAVILFFGRAWSEVLKAAGGETRFEVRSANAVAGVRGTRFEVGVASDGSTRVLVREGIVAVAGDDPSARAPAMVGGGSEIETTHEGRLLEKKGISEDANWDKWFADRAEAMSKNALKIVRHLDERLEKKRAELKGLLASRAEHPTAEIDARIDQLEREMRGPFGTMARWRVLAEKGALEGAEEIGRITERVESAEAGFEADMEKHHARLRAGAAQHREERHLPKERERRRR